MEKEEEAEQKPTTGILLYPSSPMSIETRDNNDREQKDAEETG